MRQNRANSDSRSNALWGRGSRGEHRSNALWGRGGRRAGAALLTTVAMFTFAATMAVAGTKEYKPGAAHKGLKAYVEDSLLAAVQQNPAQTFDVIVQADSTKTDQPNKVSNWFKHVDESARSDNQNGRRRGQFKAITGGEYQLTGKSILKLAKDDQVSSITANDTVQRSAVQLPLYNTQLWPWSVAAPVDWTSASPKAPTIAIVDSGIDPAHAADFGNRVVGQVNLASLTPNSAGDGYGHGTFVAGIAAGAAPGYAGVAPKANLVSVDVMNDHGQSTVADVVKAADWILANKSTYNIKVANFSLHATNRASVMFDPIDQAVERLWLNGVVVVAASGNYATDAVNTPSGVNFAPGNDPFVITVGAADIGTSLKASDDTVAPWSAWGYTGDGFMKPDLAAPGRYMIGPVTAGGGLSVERPEKVVKPGYMQLSGTSFSAPVVAGAAAMLMAGNSTLTPDQVKGILMVTAVAQPNVKKGALGVGTVNVALARLYNKRNPPNPNKALDKFVEVASDGSSVFDAAAWQSAAHNDAAWSDAAWSDAAWSDAAWSSAAWSSAAWSDAAWASAAWASAAWSDAAWSDAAWSDAAWSDGTDAEESEAAPMADPSLQDSVLAELGVTDATCDPTISICAATGTVGGLLP
jgi:serine protease AprX